MSNNISKYCFEKREIKGQTALLEPQPALEQLLYFCKNNI